MKVMPLLLVSALEFVSAQVDTPFNRSAWLSSWKDEDKDCQNTRQEVLIQESLVPPVMDSTGCKVVSGIWFSLYTGEVITDPGKLDIDHLVPLGNAHASGGYLWENAHKKVYANSLTKGYHLIAVASSANRSKQDKSPEQWMPSYVPFQCTYLKYWVADKKDWDLAMTAAESTFVFTKLKDCP